MLPCVRAFALSAAFLYNRRMALELARGGLAEEPPAITMKAAHHMKNHVALYASFLLLLAAASLAAAQGLESPYLDASVPWLRGNLHTHTTNSDGDKAPQAVVDAYAALGYDFLMLSDHDRLTETAPLDAKGMVLIPGAEITGKGPHMLQVGAKTLAVPDKDRQVVIDKINTEAGGFVIMNHPNWTANFNHCDFDTLMKLQGYVGMEIYNGVVLFLEGSELATDKWDRLLAKGHRVWGFANDDSHRDNHRALGWSMVQCASRNAEDILAAMRAGHFYASTGVKVDEIRTEGYTVTVKAANAQCFRVYADGGKMLARIAGHEMSFTAKPDLKDCTYVRVECYGEGDALAWLQPMFLKK